MNKKPALIAYSIRERRRDRRGGFPPARLRNKTVGNLLDRLTDYRQTRELRR